MITKYTFGKPIETNAVILNITNTDNTEKDLPYFEFNKCSGFYYKMGEKDIVYGLGQQSRGINKRGWKYVSNNLDNPHHQEDTTSLYGAHNFIIVSGEELFGVFFDYAGKIEFDIGFKKRSELTITADDYNMIVYVIDGESEIDIVRQFRKLIGRSYAAPKWAFGYGQSRWGYKTADDIRCVAKNYRNNNIPIDMIYLDIDYMERYKDFTIDKEAFPDFSGFVCEMKDLGIRLIPIIDAGVKIENGYDVYEEGVQKGYFCKDEDGKDFVAAVWPGRVHFPDVLNSNARKWFGGKYEYLINMGIEGFWNDMNEPAIFYTEKRLESAVEKVIEQCLFRIQPCFLRHHLCDLRTAEMAFLLVGIDNGFLDFFEKLDCFFHICLIAGGITRRVMDHQHCRWSNQCFITSHRHNRCGRRSQSIDLHSDLALVIAEHGVDLTCGKHISTGAVQPYGEITFDLAQFITEQGRCDFITEPCIFRNRPVKKQFRFISIFVFHEVPKFLHCAVSSFVSVFWYAIPASESRLMEPLTRYKLPPSSSGIRFISSSSRISLADIQPFCLAVA